MILLKIDNTAYTARNQKLVGNVWSLHSRHWAVLCRPNHVDNAFGFLTEIKRILPQHSLVNCTTFPQMTLQSVGLINQVLSVCSLHILYLNTLWWDEACQCLIAR